LCASIVDKTRWTMPRKRELKNEVFLYVKSIETVGVRNIPERRSRIETLNTDQQQVSRNLMEYSASKQIWDVVLEAAGQEGVILSLLFDI